MRRVIWLTLTIFACGWLHLVTTRAQDNYVSIGAPKCGPHFLHLCTSPHEKAEAERKLRDIKQRDEQAKKEAARKEAAIRSEMQQLGLGSHREAEARRLVEMREAAEKARPKPVANQSPNHDKPQEDKPQCQMVTGKGNIKVPANYTSRNVAEKAILHDAGLHCKTRPSVGNKPIFSDLKCTSTQGVGVISGNLRTFWSCSGSFVCSVPHEVCDGKSARGSKQ